VATSPDAPPLVRAAQELKSELRQLRFAPPVAHVYNPLEYAWPVHEMYLRQFASRPKRVVFLGMNPGPFGMVQTGVPFGEVNAVRDWLKMKGAIERPSREHAKRPVQGWSCPRSEVSGKRLWGLFAQRFLTAEKFFRHHFVLNYCPLAFMEDTGRNRTPDKLPSSEQEKLFGACDRHLAKAIEILRPQWVVGVGDFARRRAESVLHEGGIKIAQILHPSPANPAANRAWASLASAQLERLGIWKNT
jgi:single-strand selective monofunctional uracil DNA glycosylase